METTVQRWGNSNAVRIPKPILQAANIEEKDKVELFAHDGAIVIRRKGFVHRSLKERLRDAGFAETYQAPEFDTTAVGAERFWDE